MEFGCNGEHGERGAIPHHQLNGGCRFSFARPSAERSDDNEREREPPRLVSGCLDFPALRRLWASQKGRRVSISLSFPLVAAVSVRCE